MGFLPRCKNQIQGLSRTTFMIFKENCITPKPHFISISTQVQFTFDNFTRNVRLSSTNIKTGVVATVCLQKKSASDSNGMTLHWQSLVPAHRIRKPNSRTFKDFLTKIQELSRTLSLFKDLQGLENLKKNSVTFKDRQEPWNNQEYVYIIMCTYKKVRTSIAEKGIFFFFHDCEL